MKINVKIVLFEKVQAMIVVLFIAVIIISFFLLFGINYYNLSDFMKIGIFLFIICASIISLLLIIDIFTKKIEFYTIELDKLKNYDILHAFGHGVGIDIHEKPILRSKQDYILKENSIIAIEPGVYKAGKFGIRIEDTFIVGKTECRNLTKSKKDYTVIKLG